MIKSDVFAQMLLNRFIIDNQWKSLVFHSLLFFPTQLHNECVNFHSQSLNEWNYAEGAEITQEKHKILRYFLKKLCQQI